MSRNFSPYSLSLKSRLTLLIEIYNVDRSARLAWKFKLGKEYHTPLFVLRFYNVISLTAIAILVNQ